MHIETDGIDKFNNLIRISVDRKAYFIIGAALNFMKNIGCADVNPDISERDKKALKKSIDILLSAMQFNLDSAKSKIDGYISVN